MAHASLPDYRILADACRRADAAAFVHVGRDDPSLRYLTGLSIDREHAFVYVAGDVATDVDADAESASSPPSASTGRAVLCLPPTDAGFGFDADVAAVTRDRFPGEVRSDAERYTSLGARAVAALDDALGGGSEAGDADDRDDEARRVLVPRHLPHDAAIFLERAGYVLASTAAVREARAVKGDWELDRLEAVQRAACRAMERVESILARSGTGAGDETDEPVLRWEDAPLSTERVRRAANATLSSHGVDPAGGTSVRLGSAVVPAAELRELTAGETVVVSLSPRGPFGYRGALTRTFVVGGDGGWERRAHVAADAGRRVGLGELEPGVDVRAVHGEVVAEVGAFGFDVADAPEAVFGVGLARREAPTPGEELSAGGVVALAPGVVDAAEGTVALADLVVVEEGGARVLVDHPRGIVPRDVDADARAAPETPSG